jgi:hypothetical protein
MITGGKQILSYKLQPQQAAPIPAPIPVAKTATKKTAAKKAAKKQI